MISPRAQPRHSSPNPPPTTSPLAHPSLRWHPPSPSPAPREGEGPNPKGWEGEGGRRRKDPHPARLRSPPSPAVRERGRRRLAIYSQRIPASISGTSMSTFL